ncbi:hypothetical protein LOTGIDRAFT_155001 [Lottia gigantea]|uniref:Protein kinase domain-containing protein n=1 Tax=Lottia gigantea TaxID=225164 RepID=V4B9E8_LOTGI|nr:hypothetical protein LOTGIDRAFT_155001 [Lottia gigantea]ESO85514.1 hypothetical protein LOTGIDRAFT_155001 [Lottia gigantea]
MATNQWAKFKSKVKNKSKKNEDKSNIKENIIVQRLSAEVSGKAQKYTRVGAREFVPFIYDEITIQNIKNACSSHYEYESDLICDVLAGERGPSCLSVNQLPDLKVIYVRFVEGQDDCKEQLKSPPKKKIKTNNKNSCTSTVKVTSLTDLTVTAKKTQFIPKSLSVIEMLKLGTLIDNTVQLLDIYEFDIDNMCWMQLKSFEFKISKISSGGFRDAFKAQSISKEFAGKSWVIKKYQQDAVTTIASMNQTLEKHTKKVVQMHQLAKNLTNCMKR